MCVSVQLMGGLGNQLFQMSACIGYGKENGIDYCIPKHTLNDEVWKPYHFEKLNYCTGIPQRDIIVYKEESHSFTPIPSNFNQKNIILQGYFQSYLYFKDYRKEILELFGFDNLKIKKGICSVHIRRGDYLKYPTKHPEVSLHNYIAKAIGNMIEYNKILNFMVFSDDIEWCKRNIKSEKLYPIIIDFVEQGEALSDLKKMSEYEHNIIANSTYSWWGAWLNNNPDKIVICPDESNWFGIDNKHLDVSDLLPKEWYRIKY